MDKTPKTILLALALTTSVTGSAQAHDAYHLRELDYHQARTIDQHGRVGVFDIHDSSLLEGSIVAATLANAQLHGSNSSGQLVGVLMNPGGWGGFYYDGTTANQLPNAYLEDISETGIAVGINWPFGGGTSSPIMWDGSSAPQPMTLPNTWAYGHPKAISDNGDFAVGRGFLLSALTEKAVLWDLSPGGSIEPLGDSVDLVGGGTYAGIGSPQGVNDDGIVVGSIDDTVAVRWTWDSTNGWTTQHLGDLPGGSTGCTATAINNDGIVVGYCSSGGAFIWHPGDTQLTSLLAEVDPATGSGWTLELALDINDIGQITGTGTNPAGFGRSFVLSPESACLRPCTFSDGTTLQLPLSQCDVLGGQLPWAVTVCPSQASPALGPAFGP